MYGDGILYSGPTVLGNNLLTASWTTSGTWTFTNNGTTNATLSKANATTNDCRQSSIGLVQDKKYLLKFTISEYISGELNYKFGGGLTNPIDGEKVGKFTIYAINDGNLDNFQFANTFQGTIEKVTLQEITQGSDFDFTRASTGTRINEEGYIEDVPYNLATYSEDFPLWSSTGTITRTSNIAIAPDGTLTADGIQDTTGGTFKRVRTNISVSGNSTFTGSCFIKKVSSETGNTGFALVFSGTSTKVAYGIIDSVNGTMISQSSTITPVFKIESANNDYWRFSMTATDTGSNTSLEFSIYGTLSSNGTSVSPGAGSLRTIWGAQLVKGDKVKDYLPTTDRLNLPRLNYPVYGGCPSLLAEPQRTNVVNYSEDINSNSGLSDVGSSIIIDSNIVSPAGLKSVSLLKEDSSNGSHFTFKDWSLTNPSTNTISIFAKSNGGRNLRFGDGGVGWSSGFTANFDLTTGISDTGLMEYYGNGWYRCSVQGTVNAATSRLIIYITDGTTTSYQGDNTSGIYLYGFQIEQGSYATSLIHTSGSSETRNEDKALYAGLGTTDTFNDSEGVLFIETEALFNNNEARIIGINAGNGLNRVITGYPSSSSSRIVGYIQSTAGGGMTGNVDGVDTTQKHKIAFKYKSSDCSIFIDGVKRAQNNSATMPVGLKELDFSNAVSPNTAEYRGNLNAIAVYKTALTDTELANLTSYNNHDLFIPYRSRMQMISADQELQCTEHDITRFL